ncbi:MAG TPA: STAS domain-containing protein [Vicinamibacteria bacterium]|jgi:anti-sigma B factor antagonist|nr:STAS domain-containing protein [Vicinamibacteria bacterium]
MEISVEERGKIQVVRVKEAKLTYPILASFFTSVQKLVEGGARKILIDLAAVSYIDSASIGCLMDIHRLLREKEGVMKLSGLQGRVETMISMTGVHKIIDIHRDEASALASFEDARPKGKRNA